MAPTPTFKGCRPALQADFVCIMKKSVNHEAGESKKTRPSLCVDLLEVLMSVSLSFLFMFSTLALKLECPCFAICHVGFLQRAFWGYSPPSKEGRRFLNYSPFPQEAGGHK
ncbi:unnamed protein product [Rangifer tarandus platyrhynchus]|uniref:Uncharacterized protein n=1 Tax=Rangifer tarandus platyrhynchus TaxID=3082113 RepID=A0ABN9A3V1_RANTA|nr:unnamed protein product [Rangifer tarandus platyrhynchus]